MKIAIKRINLDDSVNYYKFFKSELLKSFNFTAQVNDFYIQKWNLEFIKMHIQDYQFMLAEVDSSIAGISMGSPSEGGVATILWLIVQESLSNKGIGKSLFNSSCKLYKEQKVHKIKLTVFDHSLAKYYERLGMNIEGFHPNHWWGKDIWSLGKSL